MNHSLKLIIPLTIGLLRVTVDSIQHHLQVHLDLNCTLQN